MKISRNIKKRFEYFMQEEVAVTAIEYALLGSLIALAIIASIKLLSAKLSLIFTAITTAL